jgi:Sap, sulfolipid-1-addressing protein
VAALLQIALLAVASTFWPLLLVVVLIALESGQPLRILVWFYLGGLLTTMAVGSALVFGLQDSPLMSGPRMPSAPGVDIVIGLLALLAGFVIRRVEVRRKRDSARREAPKEKKKSRSSEWMQQLVEHGGHLSFAAGIVASIFPSPLVLLGMADIAQLGYDAIPTLVVILGFYLIMFTFIELPIIGFLVAPEWTKTAAVTTKAWLDRNLLLMAFWALTVVGTFEVIRGIVGALS